MIAVNQMALADRAPCKDRTCPEFPFSLVGRFRSDHGWPVLGVHRGWEALRAVKKWFRVALILAFSKLHKPELFHQINEATWPPRIRTTALSPEQREVERDLRFSEVCQALRRPNFHPKS
jgi:hypothetical protein